MIVHGANLTARQVGILAVIGMHHGLPLSRVALAEAVGLRAATSIAYQLNCLEAKGLVARTTQSPRTLVLTSIARAVLPKPGVAVSRNGVVARVTPVMRLLFCEACEEHRPAVHRCEADLRVSLDGTGGAR